MNAPERGVSHIVKSLVRVAREEFSAIRPKIHAAQFIAGLVPLEVGGPFRIKLLKSMGCAIGEGTVVDDVPKITGIRKPTAENLLIGSNCRIGVACEFEIGEVITIGNNVTIGHQALILTTTHELGPRSARAGALVSNPVVIEDGVSLGPRCVILPGITIGAGAIVETCAVVNANIPANVRVAGAPARQIGVVPE